MGVPGRGPRGVGVGVGGFGVCWWAVGSVWMGVCDGWFFEVFRAVKFDVEFGSSVSNEGCGGRFE